MKILMLSYTFPPVAGFSPARVARLAAALHGRGHRVLVLTADRPPRYEIDPESLRLLSEGLEVLRVPAGRWRRGRGGAGPIPGGATALRIYRRLLKPWVFPDATFPWMRPAREALGTILERFRPDRLYSFAYPFSTHFLGEWAALRSGAPWIMDYGDPWTLNPNWDVPALRKCWDRRHERRMLRRASAAVFTTEPTRQAYEEVFGLLPAAGYHVVRLGCDPAVPEGGTAMKDPALFRLVYTGIYGMANRGLMMLLRSLAGQGRSDWELHLAGRDNSGREAALPAWLAARGLENRVRLRGMLPHAEALALQRSADLLLLWGWPGGLQIPAKIYEYRVAQRPILLIRGDGRDPAAALVEEGPRGLCADAGEATIRAALAEALDDWEAGNWETRFRFDPSPEQSWDVQTSLLAGLVEAGDHED